MAGHQTRTPSPSPSFPPAHPTFTQDPGFGVQGSGFGVSTPRLHTIPCAGEEQSLLEKAEQRTQAAASDAAAGLSAAWERIPKPQLGAILALWIVFLVSQRQKSKHNHCTWGYGIWCTFQVGA